MSSARLKDTGVSWLGAVPAHWAMNYLGNLVEVAGGSTPSKENLAFWDGDVPWVSPKDMKREVISDSEDHVSELALKRTSLRLIEPSAVLMVIRGMILDHTVPVALTTRPVTVNQDMKALRSRGQVTPPFLAHFLRAMNGPLLARVEEAGHGTKALRTDLWRKLPVLVPPLDEQRTIVDFLDRKTAAVDTLIEKKERLIELLKEQRRALITHAVTRGLDQTVPLRESYVDWIGRLPAHWKVWSVRNLLRARFLHVQDGNHGELHPIADDYVASGVPFLMANNVRDGKVDLDGCKFISLAQADSLRIGFAREGDVLLTHKGTIGETAMLQDLRSPYAMLTPQVTYYRPSPSVIHPSYLYLFMASEALQGQMRFIASVQSTRDYVGITAQRGLKFTVPPLQEQQAIVKAISPRVELLERTATMVRTSVEKLQAHRESLVTAAITGKISVTQDAA